MAAIDQSTCPSTSIRVRSTPCHSGVSVGQPLERRVEVGDREEGAGEQEHRDHPEPEDQGERALVLQTGGERVERRRERDPDQDLDEERRDHARHRLEDPERRHAPAMKTAQVVATRKSTKPEVGQDHVGDAERRGDHPEVGLVPLDHPHDGVGHLAEDRRHRLGGEQAGRHEGQVGRRALELGRVAVDEAAEQHAHREDVEQRRHEGRDDAALPGPAVGDGPVVEEPGGARDDVAGRQGRHQSTSVRPVEPQEDVLQGRAADQGHDRLQPALVDLGDRLLAVGAVEEQPVGQHLDPLGEVLDLGRQRLVLADAEAELGDLARRVGADQLERRALGDDHALVHDHQSVAELLGLVHVVRGEDHRHALLLEPEEPVPDDVACLRVEAGRRLVEQQHLGPVDQGPRDRQPALHAAGEVLDHRVALLGQLHELEQLVDPLPDLLARQPEVAAVDVEVVADGQLGVEGVLLRADPDPGADRGPSWAGSMPRIRRLAPAHRRDRRDHPHRGGLAGAVGPEEAEGLPSRDVDVDALDRLEVPEGLAQAPGRGSSTPVPAVRSRGGD